MDDEKPIAATDLIALCRRVITDHEKGKIDIYQASEPIAKVWPELGNHPMLYSIVELAWDIAEEYEDDKWNQEKWQDLAQTFQDYVSGNWYPTQWILSASYGVFRGETVNHSFSVVVKRRNGATAVESGNMELRHAIANLTEDINTEQTDEWYLHNLAAKLPLYVADMMLWQTNVEQYLI